MKIITTDDVEYVNKKKDQAKSYILSHKKEVALIGLGAVAGFIFGRKIEYKVASHKHSNNFHDMLPVIFKRSASIGADTMLDFISKNVPNSYTEIRSYLDRNPGILRKMTFAATEGELLHDIPYVEFKK